jgi:hypothetical protein
MTLDRHPRTALTQSQEPSPADIRPLHILEQTLQLLKRKWKDNHNYAYALDQFKSMRQDLTVSASVEVICLYSFEPGPAYQERVHC